MKIQIIQLSGAIIRRSGKLLVPVIALAAVSACASFKSFFKQADSPLSIETIHAPSGQIASVRAFESSDKLYVAGSMRRAFGYAIHYAAHVDIQLIGQEGQIIAEKQDDIDAVSPREERGRSRHYSYVASFPLTEARHAAKIRVSYHAATHPRQS
jgi:hypothetical protein